jgi:probable phosphoglycerate mutase
MNPLRLILVRHGETVENASGVVQGQQHGTLSEKGQAQARHIARTLRGEPLDAVYSSDLHRAYETALILTKERNGLQSFSPKARHGSAGLKAGHAEPAVGEKDPVIPDARLREQNFGVHEGKPVASLIRQMRRDKADFAGFNPKEGESASDFRIRVRMLYDDVRAKHPGQTVLLVTHNGPICVLLDILSCRTATPASRRPVPNGAVTVLDIDASGGAGLGALESGERL